MKTIPEQPPSPQFKIAFQNDCKLSFASYYNYNTVQFRLMLFTYSVLGYLEFFKTPQIALHSFQLLIADYELILIMKAKGQGYHLK